MFRTLGHPELCSDARFATVAARMQHIEELPELPGGGAPAPRARSEGIAALEAENAPCVAGA
jgi:hypothetical protein